MKDIIQAQTTKHQPFQLKLNSNDHITVNLHNHKPNRPVQSYILKLRYTIKRLNII